MSDDQSRDSLQRAFDTTGVERMGEAAFVGRRANRVPEGPERVWADLSDQLSRSRAAYGELLSARRTPTSIGEDDTEPSDMFRRSTGSER